MQKVIAIVILICTCIFLFVYGWYTVSIGKPNDTYSYMQKLIPYEVREVLKKTIFIIPDLKRTVERQQKIIDEQKIRYNNLIKEISVDTSEYGINQISSKKINSKFATYSLNKYPLPFPNRFNWGYKPIAYLDQIEENIILVSGNGVFYSIDKKNINSERINLHKIDTNIKGIIKDKRFHTSSKISVRDLLIVNNLVFISYTKEQTADCFSNSILVSKFNKNFMKFSELFAHEQCQYKKFQHKDYGIVDHSGGRIVPYKDNKILHSIGDYTNIFLAQNKSSMLGKVISIDLQTGDYELISMGHRNPQGLYYDKDKNIIISTEHGPQGGDEINIHLDPNNNTIENYGWPISSYGVPYSKKHISATAPLHKSHDDYGFIEPIKYFTPSIAISEIIKLPKSFNKNFTNDFFVASLGYKDQMDEGDMSIYHFRLNENYDQIIFEDLIPIGERIRDILMIEDKNQILLILENTPALAVLNLY